MKVPPEELTQGHLKHLCAAQIDAYQAKLVQPIEVQPQCLALLDSLSGVTNQIDDSFSHHCTPFKEAIFW